MVYGLLSTVGFVKAGVPTHTVLGTSTSPQSVSIRKVMVPKPLLCTLAGPMFAVVPVPVLGENRLDGGWSSRSRWHRAGDFPALSVSWNRGSRSR